MTAIAIEIGLVIAGLLGCFAAVQLKLKNDKREEEEYLLEYSNEMAKVERQRREEEERIALEEEERQKSRVFYMDVMVRHGSAFGGCAATCMDGTHRKGCLSLDQIMMYGKHPSGGEFTYYIEEEGLEICAMDDREELLLRSKEGSFEIRKEGMGRDQGVSTQSFVMKKDVLYYVVLESKHEISIKLTKGC